MDRLSHAEVGGPYSSREDAERAIRAGSFDQNAAELAVQEGSEDDEQKVARRTAGMDQLGPADPGVPELGAPMPDQGIPRSTKPAQVPGQGSSLPQSPADAQFDPAALEGQGPGGVASTLEDVTAAIRQGNPGLEESVLGRIAGKVAARLVQADFDPLTPNIEDPLHNKTPLKLIRDIKRTVPERSGRAPAPEPESGGENDGGDDGGRQPDPPETPPEQPGGESSLPFQPIPDLSEFDIPQGEGSGETAEQAAGRAGAGAAGRAMLSRLPMLLV